MAAPAPLRMPPRNVQASPLNFRDVSAAAASFGGSSAYPSMGSFVGPAMLPASLTYAGQRTSPQSPSPRRSAPGAPPTWPRPAPGRSPSPSAAGVSLVSMPMPSEMTHSSPTLQLRGLRPPPVLGKSLSQVEMPTVCDLRRSLRHDLSQPVLHSQAQPQRIPPGRVSLGAIGSARPSTSQPALRLLAPARSVSPYSGHDASTALAASPALPPRSPLLASSGGRTSPILRCRSPDAPQASSPPVAGAAGCFPAQPHWGSLQLPHRRSEHKGTPQLPQQHHLGEGRLAPRRVSLQLIGLAPAGSSAPGGCELTKGASPPLDAATADAGGSGNAPINATPAATTSASDTNSEPDAPPAVATGAPSVPDLLTLDTGDAEKEKAVHLQPTGCPAVADEGAAVPELTIQGISTAVRRELTPRRALPAFDDEASSTTTDNETECETEADAHTPWASLEDLQPEVLLALKSTPKRSCKFGMRQSILFDSDTENLHTPRPVRNSLELSIEQATQISSAKRMGLKAGQLARQAVAKAMAEQRRGHGSPPPVATNVVLGAAPRMPGMQYCCIPPTAAAMVVPAMSPPPSIHRAMVPAPGAWSRVGLPATAPYGASAPCPSVPQTLRLQPWACHQARVH
eukprot:TRINITY_DN30344_c0_g1_i1.p1 TRINITY_DN30344_c0_g1~~TRINITY_DN30344_c0_g1_i1.p1  ORF type:complete len:627 (+),score=106.52 TRINITY_DN30344_c0_g1_i1:40-1920(+)